MTEEAKPVLKRKLNLFDAVSIGLGAIIGAGIFVLIGIAAGMAGPAVFIAVIISGLSATFTALSFSELGSSLPKAGGVYEYGHELISPSIGFVLGWMWIFGNIVLGATASLGFGFYLSSIFNFIPFKVGAAIVILFVVFINIIGVKQSAIINNFIVLIKVGVLILFIVLGLPRIKLSYFDNLFPNGFIPVLQAAALFYFAYIGFPRISTTAEEVKNPERNIPLAILFSLFISSMIYLFASITAVGLIGYESLGSSLTPVADAANELGLRNLIELGALCATFSVILTSVMGQSRIFFAMARNEEMPYMLSKIHGKFETPIYSILVSGSIMLILALTVNISSLASLGSFSVLFTHVFTNYASIKLSKLNLDNPNSFKVPFKPLHAILGLFLSFVLLISSGITTIITSIFVCVLGFIWYYSYKKIRETMRSKN